MTALIAFGSDRVQDDFSTMAAEERGVTDWLTIAIGADIAASLVTGQSLEHLTSLRAKLVAVVSREDQGS